LNLVGRSFGNANEATVAVVISTGVPDHVVSGRLGVAECALS